VWPLRPYLALRWDYTSAWTSSSAPRIQLSLNEAGVEQASAWLEQFREIEARNALTAGHYQLVGFSASRIRPRKNLRRRCELLSCEVAVTTGATGAACAPVSNPGFLPEKSFCCGEICYHQASGLLATEAFGFWQATPVAFRTCAGPEESAWSPYL